MKDTKKTGVTFTVRLAATQMPLTDVNQLVVLSKLDATDASIIVSIYRGSMTDFEKLIDAAKRGDLPAVRVVLTAHNQADFINQRDPSGATALHYAAFGGHGSVVEELVHHKADINARDGKFGATPAGWAIEYLREMGGLLGIELDDFAYAIRQGDVEWVKRFLDRFPDLRGACDVSGKPFKLLAQETGNREIAELFG